MNIKLKTEIAKLELKPGDILVIKTLEHYTQATLDYIIEGFKKIVPKDVKGIILDSGVEISIIHPEVK